MTLRQRCINPASTKRATIIGYKRQSPEPYLAGLKCTNLFVADPGRAGGLVQQGVIESVVNLYETFVLGEQDIRPGDLLVFDGNEYVIHGAAAWSKPRGSEYFMHLTVEKILQ